ncbi:hypothetical protein [Phenylobacterium sp.]|uniref:hypothetical protein n=1 Tax=Phenylobacterium sp. TaxID=1871053 RepID=UPI003BAC3D8A
MARKRKLSFNQRLTVYGLWLAAVSIVVTIGVSIADRLYPPAPPEPTPFGSLVEPSPLMMAPQEKTEKPLQDRLEDRVRRHKDRLVVTEQDVRKLSTIELAALVELIEARNRGQGSALSSLIEPMRVQGLLGVPGGPWASEVRMVALAELDKRGALSDPVKLAQLRERQWRALFDRVSSAAMLIAALSVAAATLGGMGLRRARRRSAVQP